LTCLELGAVEPGVVQCSAAEFGVAEFGLDMRQEVLKRNLLVTT